MNLPVIRATVRFERPTPSDKELMVYRDLAEESQQRQDKGKTQYTYEWTDQTASSGEHQYVVRIGEILLTPPTWIVGSRSLLPQEALPNGWPRWCGDAGRSR